MATKDDIIRELSSGETPYHLSKKYPRASVYRIYNELLQSGQLPELGTILVNEGDGEPQPFIPIGHAPQAQVAEKEEVAPGKTGAEILDFTGPKGLPIAAINRIRGILGITFRPKVLSCPTPELLYPSMVISITELGFPAMRPDDFIDTVLYQWLDACDIVPYAFIKKSELEELAKTYSATEEIIQDEKFRREHGLVTTEEIKQAVLEPLAEKEMEVVAEMESETENEPPEDLEEQEGVAEVELEPAPGEEDKPQPHKPTVGDLLGRLHISNIQKEVENGSTGSSESDSPQGATEPGE